MNSERRIATRMCCGEACGHAPADAHCWAASACSINLASSIASVIIAGTYGMLADCRGRRLLLVFSSIMQVLQALASATLVYLPPVWQAHWRPFLVVSYGVTGFGGGLAAMLAMQFAYAADVLQGSHRGGVFVVMEAMIGVGAVLGSYVGGVFADEVSLTGTFMLVAGVFVACAVYSACMPESLDEQHRLARPDWGRANTVSVLSIFCESPRPISNAIESSDAKVATNQAGQLDTGDKGAYVGETDRSQLVVVRYWALVATFSLFYMAAMGNSYTQVLYFQHWYDWSTTEVGECLAVSQVGRAITGTIMPPLLYRWWVRGRPVPQRNLVIFGSAVFVASMAIMAVAKEHPWLMYVSVLVNGVSLALPFGYMRSMFSRSVPAEGQGRLLIAISLLEQIVLVLTPLTYNTLYTHTVATAGFVTIWSLAGTCSIALVTSFFLLRPAKSGDGERVLSTAGASSPLLPKP